MRELRYMLGWDQEDLAVAFSWSQSKVARFERDPSSVRLTDEDRIRLRRLRVLAEKKSVMA
jgi:transcriptional regulator with XRE-family HTH domain